MIGTGGFFGINFQVFKFLTSFLNSKSQKKTTVFGSAKMKISIRSILQNLEYINFPPYYGGRSGLIFKLKIRATRMQRCSVPLNRGSAKIKCAKISVFKIGIKVRKETTGHRERGMEGWAIQHSWNPENGFQNCLDHSPSFIHTSCKNEFYKF